MRKATRGGRALADRKGGRPEPRRIKKSAPDRDVGNFPTRLVEGGSAAKAPRRPEEASALAGLSSAFGKAKRGAAGRGGALGGSSAAVRRTRAPLPGRLPVLEARGRREGVVDSESVESDESLTAAQRRQAELLVRAAEGGAWADVGERWWDARFGSDEEAEVEEEALSLVEDFLGERLDDDAATSAAMSLWNAGKDTDPIDAVRSALKRRVEAEDRARPERRRR